MVRKKFKWKFAFLLYLVFLNVFTKSLPLSHKNQDVRIITATDSIKIEDEVYISLEQLTTQALLQDLTTETLLQETVQSVDTNSDVTAENTSNEEVEATVISVENALQNSSLVRSGDPIRPGQLVTMYNVELTPNGNSFNGRAIIRVNIPDASMREEPIRFHVEGLNIQSIVFGLFSLATPSPAGFFVDDGILEIFPSTLSASYVFLIEYTGDIRNDGSGLYQGSFGASSYLAMNLNPTNAKRVFPCMDEATEVATISFTLVNVDYNNVIGNTVIESTGENSIIFTPFATPVHRWGIVMHNLANVNNPIAGTRLWLRPGLSGQEAQPSIIVNSLFTQMETWTAKSYSEIHVGQNEVIDIIAMPDITKDWVALGTVCIWEPHILMPVSHGSTQRKTAMIEIGKGLAQQWFGFVIFPENWRYQWVNTGLATSVGYEMARMFQEDALETDPSKIDINAMFVSEIIQESLLRDGYSNVLPLEASEDLYNENIIRENVNGLMKFKAPAIMWMLKTVLGQLPSDPEIDYVQYGARALLNERPHTPITSSTFYDAINDALRAEPSGLVFDLEFFMFPWVTFSNYPVVNVQMWTAGVTLTQERFAFSNIDQITYAIPVTYTTSQNPNFEDITPIAILENTQLLSLFIDEEDWFIANIQGQGYYRVNYDSNLWDRIILALENPERREEIHPLNRATLIDDALNLARAGRLPYDTAFRLVLTMEHETHYAPWKAFVRNMEFLRKRLQAMVDDDDDDNFDSDIYVRIIRRVIRAAEEEIGFSPDPLIIEDAMTSIARGVIMEHACKAGYQPCVAAAIDWFYSPSTDEPTVNPDIPHDIRPAVYCTMMKEGDETATLALMNRYEADVSAYERLIIVKSLACSTDETFLTGILQDSSSGGMFGVEERVEFFKSLLESSRANADLALRFIRQNTNAIRNQYGGPERLEEIISVMSENMVDAGLTDNFSTSWVNFVNSDLGDSVDAAMRAVAHAEENMVWNDVYIQQVYEWIDENDAHTVVVSVSLMVICFMVNILYQ